MINWRIITNAFVPSFYLFTCAHQLQRILRARRLTWNNVFEKRVYICINPERVAVYNTEHTRNGCSLHQRCLLYIWNISFLYVALRCDVRYSLKHNSRAYVTYTCEKEKYEKTEKIAETNKKCMARCHSHFRHETSAAARPNLFLDRLPNAKRFCQHHMAHMLLWSIVEVNNLDKWYKFCGRVRFFSRILADLLWVSRQAIRFVFF